MTTAPPDPHPAPSKSETLRSLRGSGWRQPVLAVFLGLVLLVVMSLGGHTGQGVVGLGVMAAFASVMRLGGRSVTIRALRGDGRDERFALIRLKATSVAGRVTVIAVAGGFLVKVAEGHSGAPYAWLASLAGVTFLLTFGFLQWRA